MAPFYPGTNGHTNVYVTWEGISKKNGISLLCERIARTVNYNPRGGSKDNIRGTEFFFSKKKKKKKKINRHHVPKPRVDNIGSV